MSSVLALAPFLSSVPLSRKPKLPRPYPVAISTARAFPQRDFNAGVVGTPAEIEVPTYWSAIVAVCQLRSSFPIRPTSLRVDRDRIVSVRILMATGSRGGSYNNGSRSCPCHTARCKMVQRRYKENCELRHVQVLSQRYALRNYFLVRQVQFSDNAN